MDVIKIKNIDNANEHVSNIFIINLYNKIKNHITNKNNSLLEGKIECNNTYQSIIDYLTNLYNRLYITVSRDLYIEFEDELCKQYIANTLGDGIGILESDVNYLTKYNLHNVLSIPSGVTKFNELKYFTAYTRLEGLNNEDLTTEVYHYNDASVDSLKRRARTSKEVCLHFSFCVAGFDDILHHSVLEGMIGENTQPTSYLE